MKHRLPVMMERALCALAVAALICLPADLSAHTKSDRSCAASDSKPWCYWWWLNGHGSEQSITADIEAMARLGFGGLLMCDSRGYWDDDDHIVVPKRRLEVMSPEWRRLTVHAIRECHRLGLKFTMNVATSGGKMGGPWKVAHDAPKRLMCRVYPANAKFEQPDFPYCREVATYAFTAPSERIAPYVARGWYEAGDGTKSQVAGMVNSAGLSDWTPVSSAVLLSSSDGSSVARTADSFRLRFVETVIPGHDEDVDILDPEAVTRHFNRFTGALMDEVGAELVGTNRTFAGVYSVSWEGVVPSWSRTFADDFRRISGNDIFKSLPILAGFSMPESDPHAFMDACRRTRNEMFRENFYGTLRRLVNERGVMMYSENGGPWNRAPELFLHADQLAFLGMNDMPQGEFWVKEGQGLSSFWEAPYPPMVFVRGPVSAGHVYGLRRISMESFTHMNPHWSISPATLRKAIDPIFAAGANHVVWHTFTHSPPEFGVPGCEYFAGTHINGNVTWHDDSAAFIAYMTRCEALLQSGEPVVDIPLRAGATPYAGWGFFGDKAPDGTVIPSGYNYDLVDDAEWEKSRIVGRERVMASGMRYPVERPALPDMEGPWSFCHRRTAKGDIYFLQGFAAGTATFRTSRRHAVRYDAVTDRRMPPEVRRTVDGRLIVDLDLRDEGSAFILFSDEADGFGDVCAEGQCVRSMTLTNSWNVSFAYRKLSHSRHLPKPRTVDGLSDWTLSDDPDLKCFSGTATYETTFAFSGFGSSASSASISLAPLPSGVAHVYVNDKDCGTVWCAPWTAAIPETALLNGVNRLEIRYTNNWINRLIGDCSLPPAERVTTSALQLLDGGRVKPNGKELNPYSGYCSEDSLQPSGLLGPVTIDIRAATR